MKKLSFARRNALLPQGSRPLGLAVFSCAVLLVVLRFVFPGALTSLATPVWKLSLAATDATENATSYFKSSAVLQKELDVERADNARLAQTNITLAAQAQDLQKLLGSRTEARSGILAGVLARPPESPYDVVIVDQGATSGVTPGALVTGVGGIPVGTVLSVTDSTARITLYSAPGTQTGGWVGDKRIPITLSGVGGGAFEASASTDAGVVVGDQVYLPGPGAVPMGKIIRIDTDPSSASATLRIMPLSNPFMLTWVTIARASV